MFHKTFLSVLLIVLNQVIQCRSQNFKTPDVFFEAYTPKGLSISIPTGTHISIFGFHANINKNISRVESGEIFIEVKKPTNNKLVYYDPDIVLKPDDIINYWVYFATLDRLGYRDKHSKWVVDFLHPLKNFYCPSSKTSVLGRTTVCESLDVLQDEFNNGINPNKWVVEHYIPFDGPDYEFVSYQNNKNNSYVKNSKLYLKPTALRDKKDVEGVLNLTIGCTRQVDSECYKKREGVFILPPVTSARIVSKLQFKFGEVEIKAKLPSGDWIYPQIYLEQINKPEHKLWIAYARGNDRLLANDNSDIGSRQLFGGLVLAPKEPNRSTYLTSKSSPNPFTQSEHVFKVIWKEDGISLLVDGTVFGEIQKSTLQSSKFSENDYVQLVLGVGVGGINDFPDGFRSSNGKVKPWKNYDRNLLKDFFNARSDWLTTWNNEDTALVVDYVKITAL